MQSQYDIRVLTPVDVNAFRALRLHSFEESPYAFSESYEDEIQRDLTSFLTDLSTSGIPMEQFTLGVFRGKLLVGFVRFRRDQRSKARHKAMLYAMYVHEQHRGRGVGKLLLDEVERRTQLLDNLEQIHLWVLRSDSSAAGFYLRNGFVSQGIVHKDLKVKGRYVDAEYMVRYRYLNES